MATTRRVINGNQRGNNTGQGGCAERESSSSSSQLDCLCPDSVSLTQRTFQVNNHPLPPTMALSVLRASSNRLLCQRMYPSFFAALQSTAPPTPQEAQAQFWDKNRRLNRPLSPWLIYKWQITMILSLSHRATGTGMGVLLYGWGIQSILSGNTNWAQTLDSLSATFPSASLWALKVWVATAFGYHFANGIRHLLWDMGYGFAIREFYASGYFVLALTLVIGLFAALNA